MLSAIHPFRISLIGILVFVFGAACLLNDLVYADACASSVSKVKASKAEQRPPLPRKLKSIIGGNIRVSAVRQRTLDKYAKILGEEAEILADAHFIKDPSSRPSRVSMPEGSKPHFFSMDGVLTSFEAEFVATYAGNAQESIIVRLPFGADAKWIVETKSRGDGS